MKFYDSLIDEAQKLVASLKNSAYSIGELPEENKNSEIILARDTAFELQGTGFNLVTDRDLEDKIILCGSDLGDIKDNCSFARISLISLDEDFSAPGQEYNLIKKLEYVRYHFFPQGYMMRSASSASKEAVRVSKKAVRKGLSFRDIGSLFISRYKEIPGVRNVTVIFITSPEADYRSLSAMGEKTRSITETLNHVMNSVNFDCDTCGLKSICDEVEGLRELHFKRQ